MIVLNPRRVAVVLLCTVAALVAASSAGQLIVHLTGHDNVFGFVPRFSLVEEANVPTWYSSVALLACAALLAIVARTEREAGNRFVLHWNVLALLFLGLSVDEAAALHEMLIEPLRGALGVGGLFYFAWVVPALAALAVLGLAYLRFLVHLPPQTRRLFLAAAATFVGGAVGAEMAGGAWVESRGFHNAGSALLWTVEESLELVGIVVFIYALLRHLELRGGIVAIRVGGGDARDGKGGEESQSPRVFAVNQGGTGAPLPGSCREAASGSPTTAARDMNLLPGAFP